MGKILNLYKIVREGQKCLIVVGGIVMRIRPSETFFLALSSPLQQRRSNPELNIFLTVGCCTESLNITDYHLKSMQLLQLTQNAQNISSTDKEHQIEMLDVILATGWVGGELDRKLSKQQTECCFGDEKCLLGPGLHRHGHF